MTFQPFIVIDANGNELEGYPTPMLISEGGGEAYRHPETGFWRARDDSYDPPGTEYQRVRIKHVKEWYVDLEVLLKDPSNEHDEPEPFTDTVYVVAQDANEARALAPAKAVEYWQEREGENVGVLTTTIRVKDSPF